MAMEHGVKIMNRILSKVQCRAATLVVIGALLALTGCAAPSPWVAVGPGVKVHDSLDIPLRKLYEDPENYVGTVFEDQFKFYRIYHDKQDADPALRGQVILGETHFTARPVSRPLDMIQVEITPSQEAWIRERGIERQDAIRLRVRFRGIAPGSALAFELLEVIETPAQQRKP
jgi:hypothetical protein